MRKQPYPITQLTGGLDTSIDPTFLMDQASPNLQNIFLHKSLVQKNPGWRDFSANSCTGTVMFADSFPMRSGITHALFVTTGNAYRYNLSNDAFIDHGGAFSGNEDDRFAGCPALSNAGNDYYLLMNGKDPIKYWDGNTAANFANFANVANGWGPAGANISGKVAAYYKSRLVVGHTIEGGEGQPWRVRWSIAGNIANTTGTGSGFVELAETSDWITAMALMRDKLFIIKERSIWELEYVGGTTVFTPAIRINGVGSYAPASVIVLDEELIFYGNDNFYLFDGFSIKPIGKQIYDKLYEAETRIVNAAMAHRAAAAYIEELKTYMISLVHKDKTVPDLVFRYYFDEEAWTMERKEITAIGYFDISAYTAWDDLTDNWEDLDWAWNERDLPPGAPTTLIGDSTGAIYEDDRLTKSTDYMCYETKDFIFEHAVRWVEFRMQIKGGPFTVSYSTDGGTTWAKTKDFGEVSDWSECVWHLNFTSQKVRFKIECSAEDLAIKWLEPWFIPRARSKTLVTA